MQHCHLKTLSLRQLTLYYIEMRKVLFIIVFVWGMMSLYAQSLKLNKHFEDSASESNRNENRERSAFPIFLSLVASVF